MRVAEQLLADGAALFVFPEGSRHSGDTVEETSSQTLPELPATTLEALETLHGRQTAAAVAERRVLAGRADLERLTCPLESGAAVAAGREHVP